MQITHAESPKPAAPPPQTHEEYPMVMVHPHARKAEIGGVPGSEKRNPVTGEVLAGQFWSYGGQSDFMPPVTVMNENQEAMHYAQGYRRGGTSDVAAFNNMAAGSTAMPGPVIEYPKWVNGVLCANAEEEKKVASASIQGESGGQVVAPMGADAIAEPTPKPRHTASPKVKKAAAPIGRPRSEKQLANDARLAALAAAKRAAKAA